MAKRIRFEIPKAIKDKKLQQAYIAAVQAVVKEWAYTHRWSERVS